ncbi:MAG: hypothetical protein EXR67_03725 [Dehalococcoidia bacterium]|nr:hypothetical protein [Dehalococcoidia bacterium]
MKIGIGSADSSLSPRRLLEPFLERHSHLRGAQFLRLQGGVISVAPPESITYTRILLVSDAAGSVKPTSGGGIHTGILSAKLVARTVVSSLERGVFTKSALSDYDRTWGAQVRRELVIGRALRHMLLNLTPKQVDALLTVIGKPSFQTLERENGDFDFPARLFSRLLTSGPVLRALVALPPAMWPSLVRMAVQWRRYRVSLALPA